MIDLNIKNALSENIGSHNGIDIRVLNGYLKKNSSLIDRIFKLQDKPGYSFVRLPDNNDLEEKIKKFAYSQKKNKWENIIVLGIGGSALGGIALRDALLGQYYNLNKKPRLFFIDNIDPEDISQLFASIDFKKSLFIVISKSGGTVEPMALYGLVKKIFIQKKIKNYQKNLVFITDPKKGILRPIGIAEKIALFDVPPDIGGRFSVLSSVGLVPASLAGIDINGLLKGAQKMRDTIRKANPLKNPALILAILQYLFDQKKKKTMTVMMPYSNCLFRFSDWYRQLLAESIGKNNKTGPTPINALGATDQHSQLQLYNQGPVNKWFIFLNIVKHKNDILLGNNLPKEIKFLNNQKLSKVINAAYVGTAESLAKNGRPNITIDLAKIDAEILGGLFMLFEFQVALLGLLYKVNAFDQPGVEESKIITKKILSKK